MTIPGFDAIKLYLLGAALVIVAYASYSVTDAFGEAKLARELEGCAARDNKAELAAKEGERLALETENRAQKMELDALRQQAQLAAELSADYTDRTARLQNQLAAAQAALSQLAKENPNVRAQLDMRLDPSIARRVREQQAAAGTAAGGGR